MLKLEFSKESIFKSKAEMLINPVNTMGVAGAGLALEFKRKYPKSYKRYREYCSDVVSFKDYKQSVTKENNHLIYSLASKENWKLPSTLGYVRYGLLNLVDYLNKHPSISSICIPPIGAGLGGLNPMNVLHLTIYYLRRVEHDLTVNLCGYTKVKPTVKLHMLTQYDLNYREQDKYTGVGSREVDANGASKIEHLAKVLSLHGYTLSTGDARGSDTFFFTSHDGGRVRYAPFGKKKLLQGCIQVSNELVQYSLAEKIAGQTHPAWRWIPQPYKELHTRNVFQVLGTKLDLPSEFLVCWTPDGIIGEQGRSKITGGTATAIAVAERFGIPVFNLKRENELLRLGQFLNINFE